MEQRTLGSSGICVSVIGLGTVKIGRNTDVKYPHAFQIPDDRTVASLLRTARELGINLIDTAPAYGQSESRLGALLPGSRDDWVIVTKAGETYRPGHSEYDFTPEHVRSSVLQSLKRLRTDYLDAVLIHSDGSDCDIIRASGALDALSRLRTEGLVRLVGMSTRTIEGGLAAIEAGCDVLMVEYSIEHAEQRPVLDACHRAGVGVLVKKALSSGRLADRRSSRSSPEAAVRAALQPILSRPAVSSIVVGTISDQHLRVNVAAVDSSLGAP